MAEIGRLSGRSNWIDLGVVERERTPRRLMEIGIRLHLSGLSFSNTVRELEKFGVQRSRKTVHDWVHKCDLQPADDASPNYVALDETVIWIDDQQYWLYTAVAPESNELLHIRLFSTTTTALTEIFLRELAEKHDVENAVFLSRRHSSPDSTPSTRAPISIRENRNAIERIFREVKRRTTSFSNCFSHADPETGESWLQASPSGLISVMRSEEFEPRSQRSCSLVQILLVQFLLLTVLFAAENGVGGMLNPRGSLRSPE